MITMAYINGYKYTTEAKAKAAVKACNNYYNTSLNEVLGEPIEIEITEEIF